ncbi:uncharacterized protein C24B11.05 [Amaranthus tricolor]|uniref:uncharacterized protein C24B11.05 n=1 Tax=Amaranthus tricolor TaxID=29722 RepID=UPI00258BE889|nr:uncharacterized protein C24B11.05 [Amaranthus tricolor]
MDFGNASPFDCLMFDLDDTLYSSHTGIPKALKKNIEDFLVEVCGFTCDQASSMRVELFKAYGSTLAGLRALGYNIDADDYHSFVHGKLPYENIKPNPQLRNILLTITQRKIIFTNSDRVHAMKVLKRLGLEDCFEEIICFETLNPNLSMAKYPEEISIVLKPSLNAMKIAISAANINPCRTLFLDDNVRNVAAGKAMGLKTVLVGQTQKIPDADYVLETVKNLAQTIPEIWMINRSDQDDQQIIRRSRSDLENLVTVSVVGA